MKKEERDKAQIFLTGPVSPCGVLKRFSANSICRFGRLFDSSCFSYCVILGDVSLAVSNLSSDRFLWWECWYTAPQVLFGTVTEPSGRKAPRWVCPRHCVGIARTIGIPKSGIAMGSQAWGQMLLCRFVSSGFDRELVWISAVGTIKRQRDLVKGQYKLSRRTRGKPTSTRCLPIPKFGLVRRSGFKF